MKNKELTEAIAEGIYEGFWKPMFYFIVVIVVFGLVFSGLMIYGDWKYNKCYQDGTCQQSVIQGQSCFPLESLECHVVIGNETTIFWDTGHFAICGYQEANALYEQIKPRIEEDVKIDRRIYHRDSKIKYLECD